MDFTRKIGSLYVRLDKLSSDEVDRLFHIIDLIKAIESRTFLSALGFSTLYVAAVALIALSAVGLANEFGGPSLLIFQGGLVIAVVAFLIGMMKELLGGRAKDQDNIDVLIIIMDQSADYRVFIDHHRRDYAGFARKFDEHVSYRRAYTNLVKETTS